MAVVGLGTAAAKEALKGTRNWFSEVLKSLKNTKQKVDPEDYNWLKESAQGVDNALTGKQTSVEAADTLDTHNLFKSQYFHDHHARPAIDRLRGQEKSMVGNKLKEGNPFLIDVGSSGNVLSNSKRMDNRQLAAHGFKRDADGNLVPNNGTVGDVGEHVIKIDGEYHTKSQIDAYHEANPGVAYVDDTFANGKPRGGYKRVFGEDAVEKPIELPEGSTMEDIDGAAKAMMRMLRKADPDKSEAELEKAVEEFMQGYWSAGNHKIN